MLSRKTFVYEYSHQPEALAWATQVARVAASMKPLFASVWPAGLPMTSLLRSTPLAAISKSAVWGQAEDEFLRRLSQVVYSLTPSVGA